MDGQFDAGVHVLVKKDDAYLVIKRSDQDTDDPGFWDMPGGGINFGEQPIDAILREVKEETGIDVMVKGVIDLYAKNYHDKWSIESTYEAEYLSGEVTLSNEHSDYKWISGEELNKLESKSLGLVRIVDK